MERVHRLKPPVLSEATTVWAAKVSIHELLVGRLETRDYKVVDGISSRGACAVPWVLLATFHVGAVTYATFIC